MAISFFGHCALPPSEAALLLGEIRGMHPDWFSNVFRMTEAHVPSEPFGKDIARGFGIEAKSGFSLHVIDKSRLDEAMQALDELYRLFGIDKLVITREMDSIHPPPAD
ncbi:hypothetical protein FF098_012055 [Parvularcula flava]|uniref:Uncharacterized protein n=1 Tax=Aquisalinus luteolus TaxID=1566827 RepID=A0A8J3EPP1_9PROT|nr:hypothetical protein [Aquisalinus luteolus]NHK28643.1 hypothetical protein [Aquisalinus luteolus]GGH99092.1 hypothetical protein GCM10011355_24230 [Aquisalinus luteolus]